MHFVVAEKKRDFELFYSLEVIVLVYLVYVVHWYLQHRANVSHESHDLFSPFPVFSSYDVKNMIVLAYTAGFSV